MSKRMLLTDETKMKTGYVGSNIVAYEYPLKLEKNTQGTHFSVWKIKLKKKQNSKLSRTWESGWSIKYCVKISNFLVVNYLFSTCMLSIYFTSLIPEL